MLLLFLVSVAIGQEAAAGLSGAAQRLLVFAVPGLRHRGMDGLRQGGSRGNNVICVSVVGVDVRDVRQASARGWKGYLGLFVEDKKEKLGESSILG